MKSKCMFTWVPVLFSAILIIAFVFSGCTNPSDSGGSNSGGLDAGGPDAGSVPVGGQYWARSNSGGHAGSNFNSTAVDSSGNVYAAGYQENTGIFSYGAGVTAQGTADTSRNVLLVKYDSSGTALWARTVIAGKSDSEFLSVAVDASGNVYAAGYQDGVKGGGFDYGNGVLALHARSIGRDVLLVKYDPSGTALWARTLTAGSDGTRFYSVAVDASGNVYAAGLQGNDNIYYYGETVAAQGVSKYGYNAVLVKYDSNGTALWAKTANAGDNESLFNSVAVDNLGNVYVAGYQKGTGSFSYDEASAQGAYSGQNVLLVKYDSSGTAEWAQTVSAGAGDSVFNSVAIDASGNVYAAGSQYGAANFSYGEVSVHGPSSAKNILLVKYGSSGTAKWAQTVTTGPSSSEFNSVAVDASGNVYAAGDQGGGIGSFSYGNGVSVGTSLGRQNVLLVKYDPSGAALWGQSVKKGGAESQFNSTTADTNGNVYAAGYQFAPGVYTYGPGMEASGTYGADNVVLVKYAQNGN